MRLSRIITGLLVLIAAVAMAIPQKMSFQGRLLDDYGNPVDGEQSVIVSIYSAEAGGTLLFSESRTITFNSGLFHLNIGDVTPLSAGVFDVAQPWIQFTVAGETMPRQPLTADAYSFRSTVADTALWVDLDTLGAYVDTSMISSLVIGIPDGGAAFRVQGEPWFPDSLTLVAGDNVHLTQIGRDITVSADQYSGAAFRAYGQPWIGDSLILRAGSNVTLSQTDDQITISATAGGSGEDHDWIIDGENMFSGVAGNVGIGTETPLSKLHVSGNIFSTGRITALGTPTTSSGDTLIAWYNGGFYKYVPDSAGATYWQKSDSVLWTKGNLGLSRGDGGNLLFGSDKNTHVNFGSTSQTGQFGYNRAYSTVSGGQSNQSTNNYATVAGGKGNHAIGEYSFIGGGIGNSVEHRYAVVSGGDHNEATYLWSTVGGGYYNEATESYSVIAGGGYNDAMGWAAAIGGGNMNAVYGMAGTIAGGKSDTVNADYGFVGGGISNAAGSCEGDTAATVSGGWYNKTQAKGATVSGGFFNRAEGEMSCIPGGSYLAVGDRSFGFRGGFGGNPNSLLDLSGYDESFFIADADFHFNPTNANADFRVDGTADNLIAVDGLLNRVMIGTGTVSPYLFFVNGSAAKPGSGTWTVYSDGRLKENVFDYGYGLNAVTRLRPVTYNYRPDNELGLPSELTYTGIIAQELQVVIPEAVEMTENGYLAVDTDPVIWALVNAVQELKQENDALRKRVDALELNKTLEE